MNKEKMKQSLLIGALTSSFGIFISKLLGLFYYSPLSSMAGEANMAFYSIAYTYYDLLLQVSQAGIPFAIATLVARYMMKEDYKSVMLIKKMGTSIIMGLSFVVAAIFIFVSEPLARQSLGVSAPLEDIENLKLLFMILAVAVILVPLLSSLRGYVQGLKRMDIYASSQVLEQFARVFTILFVGYLAVVILKMKSIYAIFIAIAAASVGAIVAYVYTIHFSKDDEKHVIELAPKQEGDPELTVKQVIIEIITLGIPYVIISFLGTAGPLVNTTYFMDYMTRVNGPEVYESAKLAAGILQANIAKISSIPSVLALGFGSGMVPYLAETLEAQDYDKLSKQISQILDTSFYILIPMIFIFLFFARDIYFIMYGNSNLDLGTSLFTVSNIQILLGTVAPIFSSIMMSLKLRKEAIFTLIVSFILKFLSFFPMVRFFGAYGMIYSSGVYYAFQIGMYFWILKSRFDIKIGRTIKRTIRITICSLIMVLPALLLHYLIGCSYTSRVADILLMIPLGVVMVIVYYLTTSYLKLPQLIFNISDVSISGLINRFVKK
ncbi:MAG: oligosaccharide flippase family protein [Erysipelotrichaceae bacterium]|nr:oligosaccharide flippase family protein [Erysipelotrichaceae bacterium]